MRHHEDDEQKALIAWARCANYGAGKVGDWLIAIPNGGKRNIKEAARLKAHGVKAGVSDLFLPVPKHGFHGLWIELKAPKTATLPAGKPTAAQIDWLSRMAGQGYMAVLSIGWENAKITIEDYLRD